MHTLKIEVGGDSFSGCGSEPSIEHSSGDTDDEASFKRGYEGDVVKAALYRNPSMLGYTLSWGFPGHLAGYLTSPLTNRTISYQARFCRGAKEQWGYTCDYTGIHNEMPWTVDYVKDLRRQLDAIGLNETKVVVSDNFGDFDPVAKQILADQEMKQATAVIGAHYPHASNSTPLAVSTGTPLWSSEDSSTFFDAQGGACLARILNWNVLYGNMTSTIVWNLASSYLEQLHWYGDSLIAAAQPWSGSYYDTSPLWAMAHWGQFVQPGYRFLHPGMGAGELPGGGTFVTLVEPPHLRRQIEAAGGLTEGQRGGAAHEREAMLAWLRQGNAYRQDSRNDSDAARATGPGGAPMDWVVVLETTTLDHSRCIRQNPSNPWPVADTQDVTFALGQGMRRPSSVVVWKSVFFQSDGEPVTWFERLADVQVSLAGTFTITGIRPDSQYTIASRDSGQTHGVPKQPPANATVFPPSWTEDFESTPEQRMAKYFSDQSGTFAATDGIAGAHGYAYLQNVTAPPSTWHFHGDDPVFALSIGGRFDISDSDVSARAAVLEEASWTSSNDNPVLSLRPCSKPGPSGAVPGDMQWVFDPPGVLNGSIANAASRQCLDVLGCNQSAGTPAWMWGCVDTTDANCDSNNQRWDKVLVESTGGFKLKTRMQSGLCLSASIDKKAAQQGASDVTMQPCGDHTPATQVWQSVGSSGQLQAMGQSGPQGQPMCLSAMPPGAKEQATMVAVGARLGGAAASNSTSAACAAYSSSWYKYGYWLFLQSNGTWILSVGTSKPAGVSEAEWEARRSPVSRADRSQVLGAGAATEAAFGYQTVLASGSIPAGHSGVGTWHTLRLKTEKNAITAWVDGVQVAAVQDATYALGWVGIGSGYHRAAFDDWSANSTSLGLALSPFPRPSLLHGG